MRWIGKELLLGLLCLSVVAGCNEVKARRKIQEGTKAYRDGKYDSAIVLFNDALRLKPELATGWYNLAQAHLAIFAPGVKGKDNEAQAEGAINAFRTYLDMAPKDGKARDQLLQTYIDAGKYEFAIKYFEDELKADPNNVLAVAQLARINSDAGNFAIANQWNRKRVDMEVTADAKADAWYSIGVLSWRRLYNHPTVIGVERAKIADEGLFALEQAAALRKDHQATISYSNLLYRERALAHDAWWARAVDLTSATVYMKTALELAKANQAKAASAAPRN